jgi:hypothetical protein
MALGLEPVEELAAGRQPVELDVDAVRGLRAGDRDAAADHVTEALVGGELPVHHDGAVGHAAEAVLGERLRGEAGPEHEAVVVRVAGGHAERERVRPEWTTGRCCRPLRCRDR